ncbi:MAG: hypothetical protein IPM51_16960 [Sphingobacteriaceae bacterium]|nr:hypothetical protein [Sphingobacteriaceae bacterium]
MSISTDNKYASIEKLFDSLSDYEISYAYRGDFTQKLTDSILALSETKMEVINEPLKNRKKVYFIMVESLQNITRHQDSEVLDGFFSIHKSSTGFLITSGNVIETKNVEPLKTKFEKLNSMTPEQLKEHYYEVLNEGGFSDKGGAGLGLIEMVRKSGNKLSYEFSKVNDTHSFFYYQINVKTGGAGDFHSQDTLVHNFVLAKNVHNMINDNHVKLFFHGRFEHESLKSLISMTETSLSITISTTLKKTIVAVMIEMLQNISYHGVSLNENAKDKPGLLMLCEEPDVYNMITGNFILNEKIEHFEKHVNYINSLDDEGLNKLYNEVILKENNVGELGAGLGLIDLRFKTQHKIETAIIKRSDTKSFLIVKTSISI